MIEELLNALPDFVLKVLSELKEEEATESIWLVGSRANQTSTPDSDWDLLVFSTVEPEVVSARCQDVDVIQVGPSGQVLLEGQGLHLKHSFASWQWREIDEVNATYVGKQLIDYPPGARDSSGPVYSETKQPSYRIWAKPETLS